MADAEREAGLRPNVLLLEPDIIVSSEISEFLRDCGYRVIEAATGAEAMLVLVASGIRIDVVMADATSPGTPDAFGLAQWVRANRSETRVILAGSTEMATNQAGDLCDDGPMLAKPYDPQVVLDRIKRLMAARDRG